MRCQNTSTTHIQDLSSSNLAFNNNTTFNRSQAAKYRDLYLTITLRNESHIQRDRIVVVFCNRNHLILHITLTSCQKSIQMFLPNHLHRPPPPLCLHVLPRYHWLCYDNYHRIFGAYVDSVLV
jgi:hypothetical protein